jgi:predicted permease
VRDRPENFHCPPPIDLEGRSFPRRNDLWTPLAMEVTNRAQHYLTTIARLRRGVSVESADAGMRTIAERLAEAYPETNRDYRISVVPFERMIIGDMKLALLVLLGAVGLVLLIACVNVANLLMTRFAARQKEYAVRAALGAGRWRIIRHSIVESQLLALAGGLVGLALGSLAVQAILRVAPANVPRLEEVRIDRAVIAYTFGIAVLTGLVFGLIPVLRALKPDLAALLRGGGRGAAGSGEQSRLRAALVVAEVSLSLVLLVGAGLLFSSFLALRGVDTGLRAERVLTMRTSLGSARYPELPRVVGSYRAIEESVATLPGVESAGFSYDVPLVSDFQGTRVLIEGDPAPAEGEEPRGHFSITTPAYFETMGIPLVSGRFYRAEDTAESTPVILVNETFARLYFGGRDPVGRRIEFQNEMRTIVGVVGDVRLETLTDDPTPAMYVPHAQAPQRAMSLIVRAATDPLAIAGGVREAIRGVDPAAPVYDVRTMEQILGDTMAQPRFSAFLLIAFSVVALLLAAIGMYGVISFMVTQQTREIGIRLALGARPADELKRVIGGGSRLLGIGAIIGLIVPVLASRVLGSLLFEIDPLDVGTLAWTTVFLLSVGLLACGVPALRASRVAPMEALRYE